jgi:membrane fusion protein (multidrug efflux system)
VRRNIESTDDAQIDGDLVSVPARTSGVVARVLFTDNQHVSAGELLVELDADVPRARLAQANAALAAAEASAAAADADSRVAEAGARANEKAAAASLHGAGSSASASTQQIREAGAAADAARVAKGRADTELARSKRLFAGGATPQADLDRAQAMYDGAVASLAQAEAHAASLRSSASMAASRVEEASARYEQSKDVDSLIEQARARAAAAHAQVETAKAMRDIAALDVKYAEIRAPADGVVSKRAISVGQMVAPGQPVVSLAQDGRVWVTANFKETQIEKMKVGQPVEFTLDAFPKWKLHGEIESFSAATGAKFTLLPPDNASGNYTKVVQRVPVHVKIVDPPSGVTLRPGLSAELEVDTGK